LDAIQTPTRHRALLDRHRRFKRSRWSCAALGRWQDNSANSAARSGAFESATLGTVQHTEVAVVTAPEAAEQQPQKRPWRPRKAARGAGSTAEGAGDR
jgi:hypothetical protein